MDYENVYYVGPNDGWRNAPVVMDHRRAPARSTTIVTSAPPAALAPVASAPMMPATAPYQYPQQVWYPNNSSWAGYPVQPQYVMPPVGAPGSNLATILGGFGDVGSLANIIAQVFAALLPLPSAPTPQDGNNDSDPATNAAVNSSNLIRYQNALALFARRDQQILTLGSVLKELFKRPGSVA
jgi:hypothetical protein